MDLDYLFYLIVFLLTHFLTPGSNIFIKLITSDSLFCTYRFFRSFVDKNLTESQVISQTRSLYKRSILDRYIFYLLSYLLYKLICGFFWVTDINVVYYAISLLVTPQILNKILIGDLYNDIKRKKEYIVKMLTAKMFSISIRFLSKTYLDRDVRVKSRELIPLLDNYDNTINYILEVGKSVGLTFALAYVKKYSPNFYYKIMTYVYNQKTGNMLVSYNEISAKRMLNDIINRKKWDELLKPNVYKAIVSLYHLNADRVDVFKDITINVNFSILKFVTVWTVASYLETIYIVPILSIFFLCYRKGTTIFNDLEAYYRFGVISLGLLAGLATNNILLTSVISQFGYFILVNKLTITLAKYLIKKSWKQIKFVYIKNSAYLMPVLMAGLHLIAFHYLVDMSSLLFFVLHLIYLLLVSYDWTKLVIFCTLLLTTSLSDFNPLHILYNIIIIYIGVGKMDFSLFEGFIEQLKSWCTQDWNIFGLQEYKNEDELVKEFEYMDTDKFPSISNAPQTDFLVRRNCEDLDNLNTQKVEHRIQSSAMEGIDENIFNLPRERFINAIGVDDDDDEVVENVPGEEVIEETEVESKDGSHYTVRKSNDSKSMAIMHDFC